MTCLLSWINVRVVTLCSQWTTFDNIDFWGTGNRVLLQHVPTVSYKIVESCSWVFKNVCEFWVWVIFALIRRSPRFWVRLNASIGGQGQILLSLLYEISARQLSTSDFLYPLVNSFEMKKSYFCSYSVSELEFRIYRMASTLTMPEKHAFERDESLERYWNVSQGLLKHFISRNWVFLNLSPLYSVKSRKLISVFDHSCLNFKVGCTVFIRLMFISWPKANYIITIPIPFEDFVTKGDTFLFQGMEHYIT